MPTTTRLLVFVARPEALCVGCEAQRGCERQSEDGSAMLYSTVHDPRGEGRHVRHCGVLMCSAQARQSRLPAMVRESFAILKADRKEHATSMVAIGRSDDRREFRKKEKENSLVFVGSTHRVRMYLLGRKSTSDEYQRVRWR